MMRVSRRVPLARRNLFADRRRLAVGVIGVGLALMLVLLLDGLWEGVRAQATVYPNRVGADLFVAQPGVADFLGETSTIPRATVDVVRSTPGVKWAAPVRGQFVVFELHGKKVAAYVVGSVPGQPGGAWSLSAGRQVRRDDEVTVDAALARRHGLGIGDVLTVVGRPFRIVGLAHASVVMTGFVFVTHHATDELLRSPGTTSFVLVGARDAGLVQRRLEAKGLNVLSRAQLAANDRALYTGIFGSILRLMVGVAFVAGVLIVALTVYVSVVERRREYGIVRALGAGGWTIAASVLRQTLALTAIGLAVGLVFFAGGRWLITELRPQFQVDLTSASLLRAVGAALLMGVIASLVPARRVTTTDPAAVYREH
jgi:putative ABC transport system permease protein